MRNTQHTKTTNVVHHLIDGSGYSKGCNALTFFMNSRNYLCIGALPRRGNIFKGLAASGSWGCFDEFNRLVPEVLSVCTVWVLSWIVCNRALVDLYALCFGKGTVEAQNPTHVNLSTISCFWSSWWQQCYWKLSFFPFISAWAWDWAYFVARSSSRLFAMVCGSTWCVLSCRATRFSLIEVPGVFGTFFLRAPALMAPILCLYFRVSHSSYKTAPESDSSKIAWNSLLLSTASDAENCKVLACSLPWTRATWGVPSCLKGLRRYLGPSPSWCQISCSSWKTCSSAGQKLLVYICSVISDGMLGVHKPTLSQTWASGSQHINIQELLAKQMHTLWLSMFWLECGKWSRALLVSQKSRGSERKHEMSPKCCWQHAMMLMLMLKMNKIEEDGNYRWSWLAAI